MQPIKITVLVCSRDRLQMINNLLTSLSLCPQPVNTVVDLIVIDNASTVPYPEEALKSVRNHFPSKLIRHEIPGKSRSLNLVVSQIDSDYIIFLDDDVVVYPDILFDYANAFQTGEYGMFAGKVMLCEDLSSNLDATGMMSLAHFMPTTSTVGSVIGANFACSRNAFKTVGGFDEALGPGALLSLGEDTLIGYEYGRHFGPIPVCGSLPVVHYPSNKRSTMDNQLRFIDISCQAEAYISRKLGLQALNLSLLELLKLVCFHIAVIILRNATPLVPQITELYLRTYRKLRMKISLLAFSK